MIPPHAGATLHADDQQRCREDRDRHRAGERPAYGRIGPLLSLGVQSRRPSAQSAMAVVDERAATLVSALRDAGARDEDLRTTGLNLWFDQSDRAYVASYSLHVGIPADDVGRFIDSAAEVAGDEFTLNGVSFSVSDPAAVRGAAARARRRRRPGQGRGPRRRPPSARSARS